MRNLKVGSVRVSDSWLVRRDNDQRSETSLTLPSVDDIEAVCIGAEERIFCACSEGIYELSSSAPELIEWTEQRNGEQIVSFDYLSDEYLLCAVFSSGAALLIDTERKNIERCEVVQAEIIAACWAPDYHVLLLASKKMLYFITRQFDVFVVQSLSSATCGREELMTIGWGSKETQFRGSGARKQQKNNEAEELTVVTDNDQRRTLLSWSGDANYVAVSYVDETNIRRFCVYDHEGELVSRLEQSSNVEETLTYRPPGNLIATSRLLDDIRWIIFYERIGQRRSNFELGSHKGTTIDWMSWNADGSILCVRLNSLEGSAQEVQFWCVSNYDWMMKYRIVNENGFLLTCWHESNSNCFCYITRPGRILLIEFDFAYDFHDGTVLSIAGSEVRVTNLKAAPIPPPMCHYKLTFPSAVCEVVQRDDKAVFLLADHSLHAYKLIGDKFVMYAEYDTALLRNDTFCYNLCLNASGELSAVVVSSSYALYRFNLKDSDSDWKCRCLYSSEKPFVCHLFTNDDCVLQGFDGEWFCLRSSQDKESNSLEEYKTLFGTSAALRCCRYFLPITNGVIGISKRNELIVNGRSILKYINSYSMDKNYLLTVTLTSQSTSSHLQISELNDVLSVNSAHRASRAVERGAMLIGHEDNGTRVWLQMPRGNLETIHLKELILRKLKELLDTCHFNNAALIMKKHRIDMNLFYDHNPEFFMNHIGQFVDDVGNAELLNLFVANLNDTDVTKGIYSENYRMDDCHLRPTRNGKLKVRAICSLLRDYIMSLNDKRVTELYTTVISTYLKEQPPQISQALLALHEQSSKLSDGPKLEEKWISFVSLLAADENLFKVALSTYDLNLALAVARNSQMDPKEYLPLLAHFRAHSPPAYQKFKIDTYLGLYKRAILNHSELDDHWDEAAGIIKLKNLYTEALVIYGGKKNYLKICELCASHLMDKRSFEEAALLYMKTNNIDQALQCYQGAYNWKKIIECGQIHGMKKDTVDELLKKMIPYFRSSGKFHDLAGILAFIDEKSNREEILECYCKIDAWDLAVSFVIKNEDLKKILYERIYARYEQISQNVEHWRALLEQYSCRLELVRQKKKDTLNAALEKIYEENDISLSEVFSETSVTMSDISKISATSSASAQRRKHIEKKKKVLKEGSHYEDAALLNAIKDVVLHSDAQQDELIHLLPALIVVDAIKEAHTLQSVFIALIKHAQSVIEKAWPTYLSPHMIPGPLSEIYRGADGNVRPPEGSTMPARIPLESELIRPQIRDLQWKLEICN